MWFLYTPLWQFWHLSKNHRLAPIKILLPSTHPFTQGRIDKPYKGGCHLIESRGTTKGSNATFMVHLSTTFSICAHILNTCIEHCVSSYCIDSLYSEPIYVTHATGSCITSSARHEHCEAPTVHTEDILGFYFEIPFSVSVGYMSVMSQRPCRIHQVWCSRSQLEWRAVVWAAWQRLLWKCEMSVKEMEGSVNETCCGGWFVSALTDSKKWRC